MTKRAKVLAILPPTPLGFSRSGLFGIAKQTAGDDDFLHMQEISSDPRYNLIYTGPRLNQSHALVWQAVVQQTITGVLETDVASLLRAIGLEPHETRNRDQLRRWLQEMGQATVILRSGRYSYQGPLLHGTMRDEVTGRLVIAPNKELDQLLEDEVLLNDLQRKAALPGQLAKALHDLIAGHQTFPKTPVKTLFERYAKGRQSLRGFRQEVKRAMQALTQGPKPLVIEWTIDEDDRLVVAKKATTRVKLLPPGTASKKIQARAVQSDVNAKVAAARKKRTEVAL